VVFKLDPSGNETVLYNFTGGADGGAPFYAGVVRDSAGNLYGATYAGGNGVGVVYKIDTNGIETVLHTFTHGADGYRPYAGVALDAAGNLYGTTSSGGLYGNGTVYKIGPGGQGTVLHAFSGPDGSIPLSGVTLR
jgi:uncharacterized repeat protein (TIGR03803 family)